MEVERINRLQNRGKGPKRIPNPLYCRMQGAIDEMGTLLPGHARDREHWLSSEHTLASLSNNHIL